MGALRGIEMIGQKLGHYRITEKLGSGGMGEVFKARDERLDRDVAIKVLREELASHPERLRRFEQEARSASALNHPNIIHIYDIRLRQGYGGQVGKHGDTPYIAMEYVEGQTLREILAGGPLPAEKLLRLATQMAEGIAKAHAAGIIHRDLKPENLMVTSDGYVKILDFGLAKLLAVPTPLDTETSTETREGTAAGTVMGTASYMSPEQALGKALDARTDVFSMGAVLYEMATGTRPFQGDTAAGLFDEILHKTPVSVLSLNPSHPKELDRIVTKAIEKNAHQRYPSSKELFADLNRVLAEKPLPEDTAPKSIVVLPFDDLSPDRDNEYFSDGLTEEVIADLSQLPDIRVISRISAMALKGTKKTGNEISKELNVQYVLEGSVRKAGNNLRITAQLIDATNDTHLWAEKYNGTLEDVFEIQEKVSRSIVRALKVKLTPSQDHRLKERPIDNVKAYECFLRAKRDIDRYTTDGLQRALKELNNGFEIVGDNVLLHAGMGLYYFAHINAGMTDDERYLLKMEECAESIFRLDAESPHGHRIKGIARYKRGYLQEAVKCLAKALEMEPNDPDNLMYLSYFYGDAGRPSKATSLVEKLEEIDPLYPFTPWSRGWLHLVQGEFELSLAAYRQMHQMHQEVPVSSLFYGQALVFVGDHEEARRVYDSFVGGNPSTGIEWTMHVMSGALVGEKHLAVDDRTERLERLARIDEVCSWMLAEAYALLGDQPRALDALENAVNHGLINYPFLSETDPLLKNLRGTDGFRKLMERVKNEWENFEV